MKKFQTLTGMHDILPDDFKYFDKVYRVVEKMADFYNYSRVEPPILEDTDIYFKGTGQDTEIVEKQMYSFKTKGEKSITLRPETTPGIVRAYIEHGMSSWAQPVKLYSYGPVFRYERPQAGRYRQFNQFNFDVFGDGGQGYITDVEIIQIAYKILQELGLENIVIDINSIGGKKCRSNYNKTLKKYLKKYSEKLCQNCLSKIDKNPLRFLDCKEESCKKIKIKDLQSIPKIIDYLEEDAKKDFAAVLEMLDFINIPYNLNHSLVRGLDYYTKTVFELVDNKIETSFGGGGRYDNMIKLFGGKEAGACGFAIGIERVVNKMKEIQKIDEKRYKFYLAQLGTLAKNNSLKILEELRKNNIDNIYFSLQKGSLGSQLSQADKLNIEYVLILGQQECVEKKIIIRNMKTGEQKTIKQENLLDALNAIKKL